MIRAVRIRTERRQAVGECARAAILPLGFASIPPETGNLWGAEMVEKVI